MALVGWEGVVGGVNGVDCCGDVREVAREPGNVFLGKVAGDDHDGGGLGWWVGSAMVEEDGVEEGALVGDCDGSAWVVEVARYER